MLHKNILLELQQGLGLGSRVRVGGGGGLLVFPPVCSVVGGCFMSKHDTANSHTSVDSCPFLDYYRDSQL